MDLIVVVHPAGHYGERGGPLVGAGLYAEGITLARVDAAGKDRVQADYQRDHDKAREAGKDDARLRRASFKEGELVAVTKWGDVHRLNPKYIDTAKLERAATGLDPAPTLSDARTYFATAAQERKAQPQQDWNDRAATRETQGQRYQAAQDIKDAALGRARRVR